MSSVHPKITARDIRGVLADSFHATRDEEFDVWVEENGFENEAMVEIVQLLMSSWLASGQRVEVLALMAFTVGWDGHFGLRGERDEARLAALEAVAARARRLAEEFEPGFSNYDDPLQGCLDRLRRALEEIPS